MLSFALFLISVVLIIPTTNNVAPDISGGDVDANFRRSMMVIQQNKPIKKKHDETKYSYNATNFSSIEDIVQDMKNVFGEDDDNDDDFLNELKESCLPKWNDSTLEQALDAHFTSIIKFYQTNPIPNDTWVNCLENSAQSQCTSGKWVESNLERWNIFGEGTQREIVVMEPCNYASGISFLHSTLRVCEHEWVGGNTTVLKAIKRSFVVLASSTSFMHASSTSLAQFFDEVSIASLAFVAYENLILSLDEWIDDDNLILKCINETIGCASATDIVDELTLLPFNVNLDSWHDYLNELSAQIPSLFETFPAIVTMVLYLICPVEVAEGVSNFLADLLLSSEEETYEFIVNVFVPEVLSISSNVQISTIDKGRLFAKFVGMASKLIYAFIWQEEIMGFVPPTQVLRAGNIASPLINLFASAATGYQESRSSNYVWGKDLYPGFKECNKLSPHSLWHQQASEGLVDFMLFFDEVASVVSNSKK